MLCHDEQRLRLVLANGRRPELGLAPLRRTGTDLAGRLLCADTHGREQNQHQFLHRKSVAASRKPNSVPAFRRVTIIPLAAPSLARSSDRPGDQGRAVLYVSLFGLAPCGVLPATRVATGAVRSYRTFSPLLGEKVSDTSDTCSLNHCSTKVSDVSDTLPPGGMFSVPLSFGLPRPGVTRRTALRSSDFPPTFTPCGAPAGDRLSRCERLLYTVNRFPRGGVLP